MTIDSDNEPPVFSDTSQERSVEENTDADIDIGTAVAATDDGGSGNLTYSLGGTDATAFDINNSGQISTVAALDYETKRSYRVTVTATDRSHRTANANVTININPADEAPEITSGDTAISYAENDTGALGTYQASDPERATIVWTLEEADASAFSISSGGVLTFNERAGPRDQRRIFDNSSRPATAA